jgi:hypothetical protein
MDGIEGFDRYDIEWICGAKCEKVHTITITGEANDYALIGVMVKLVMDNIFATIFGFERGARYDITDEVLKAVLIDAMLRAGIDVN